MKITDEQRAEVRTFVLELVQNACGIRFAALAKAAKERFGREETIEREVDRALQHLRRTDSIDYSSDGWRPL